MPQQLFLICLDVILIVGLKRTMVKENQFQHDDNFRPAEITLMLRRLKMLVEYGEPTFVHTAHETPCTKGIILSFRRLMKQIAPPAESVTSPRTVRLTSFHIQQHI